MSDDIKITFDLHAPQMQVYMDPTRFRVLAAGRRFGKSTLAVAEAACAALDPANVLRQPVFLIAPTQPQAKMIYWRQLIEKLYPVIVNTNVNEGLITLQSGVMIGVKGADNPDALRGPGLWAAVLDEYGNMKPFVWSDIVRPMLVDSRGRALFIGTPPLVWNHFSQLYADAAAGLDPEIKAWSFESIDNPYLPQGEVEAARRNMSTEAFNREFRASFATNTGRIFKAEQLIYVDSEPKAKDSRGNDIPQMGQWFVAIDLAGFAGIDKATTSKQKLLDEHCITIAKITPDDDWYVKSIIKGRWSVKEAAEKIVSALDVTEPTAWGIEQGALMRAVLPYVNDEARRRKLTLSAPVPLSHENRIKTERITWALQGRLEHGKIKFQRAPWNKDVEDQLTQFPSTLVHDDIPDSLSYIAQLSEGRIVHDFAELADTPYWQPVDADIGF